MEYAFFRDPAYLVITLLMLVAFWCRKGKKVKKECAVIEQEFSVRRYVYEHIAPMFSSAALTIVGNFIVAEWMEEGEFKNYQAWAIMAGLAWAGGSAAKTAFEMIEEGAVEVIKTAIKSWFTWIKARFVKK